MQAPLAPPPVPPVSEPTLTESTNIDKNDAKKNSKSIKKRKLAASASSAKRKPDAGVKAVIEKNENYQDDEDQLDDVEEEIDAELKSPVDNLSANESSSLSRDTTNTPLNLNVNSSSSFAPISNLDDNTLDGFSFANRNKTSSHNRFVD